MAFASAQQTRVIGDEIPLSAYTTSVNVAWQEDMLETTTLVDTAKQFIPGMTTSTFHVDGILDVVGTANTSSYDNMANGWKTTADVPFTVAPRGYTFGNEVVGFVANETNFTTSASVGDKVLFSIDGQTDGWTDYGYSYHDLTAETTSTNSTFIDGAAASTTGGAGYLHVSAYSGLTNIIVVVQDATTSGGAYSTILTFSTVTGLTSQRVAITGTVRQFTRCLWTVTGVGSCTFAVGFARR